jgi:hypothetical protein
MKNQYLIWGAVAVGAYLIYKKMGKPTDNGKELAPPPVSNTQPAVGKAVKAFKCPTKEQMARSRYTEEGMAQLKAMGCI